MERQPPQGFWTTMVGPRSVMEANNRLPDDPAQMVSLPPYLCQPDTMLDGEKTAATLLFSGVFLTLVGVAFTTMGWQNYQTNSSFEWTQLLGPVLISVGGTFILTGVCKFGIVSCWPCRRSDNDTTPATDQTSRGRSCALNGVNQPIVLRGAATMLCIPPPYGFIAQGTQQAGGGSVGGFHVRDGVYCVDNAAFTSEEEERDGRRRRAEKAEVGGGRGRGGDSSSPPAYEDIFPSFDKNDAS